MLPDPAKSLAIRYTNTAHKHLGRLDATLQRRIKEKLAQISLDPLNPANSLPLVNTETRKARVGAYRILLRITKETVDVLEIAPRGDVYKKLT